MKHFAWDYEESGRPYYHIYDTDTDEVIRYVQDCGTLLTIDMPQTPEADRLVQEIVDRLDALVERAAQQEEEAP